MLLCGADLVASFYVPRVWIEDQVREILRDFGVVCIARKGTDVERVICDPASAFYDLRDCIHVAHDFHYLAVSSSEVRTRVRNGKEITDLVHKDVQDYIASNGLYWQHQS